MRPWQRQTETTPEQELLARRLRREKDEALQERASRYVRDSDGAVIAHIEVTADAVFVHLSPEGRSRVSRPWMN
jgi:hypothetical protein